MAASDRRSEWVSALSEGEAAETRGDYVQASAAYGQVAADADPATAAEGLFRLGRVDWRLGRFDQALRHYEETRTAGQTARRTDLVSKAENGIGAVHYSRGEYAQARASYQLAMQHTEDPVLTGQIMLNLGVIANIEGDLANALWHYRRARALFADHGDRGKEALALRNLGMVHADQEEWEAAADAYEQCLGLCESLGNRPMIAKVLLNQAEVFVAEGAFERAVRNCDLSISISVEIGDEVERGEALRWQGFAHRMAGDAEAAERVLTEATLVAQRFRVKLLEAESSRELWELKRASGARDAGQWRDRAIRLFRELGAEREAEQLEGSEPE